MSAHPVFAPRQTRKASPVSPESGLALVAHRLHGTHGPRLPCKSCASSERERKGSYIKNVAGKRDGEDRYYRRWSCTTNGKFSCPTLGNAAYIEWARSQLARDSFSSVVESVRRDFPIDSLEHHRLGLLLQDGPSPPVGSPSLKRKGDSQTTPAQRKRPLLFFGSEDTTIPSNFRPSHFISSTASAPSNSGLVCSPPSDLIRCLVDVRDRVDAFLNSHCQADGDRTRENSLSPEEYISIHQARGSTLPGATTAPPTPPDRSSPSNVRRNCVETCVETPPSNADVSSTDVVKEASTADLATTLATDFHSVDASGKKIVRARAKSENVVAAFEEEVRRIGARIRARA